MDFRFLCDVSDVVRMRNCKPLPTPLWNFYDLKMPFCLIQMTLDKLAGVQSQTITHGRLNNEVLWAFRDCNFFHAEISWCLHNVWLSSLVNINLVLVGGCAIVWWRNVFDFNENRVEVDMIDSKRTEVTNLLIFLFDWFEFLHNRCGGVWIPFFVWFFDENFS